MQRCTIFNFWKFSYLTYSNCFTENLTQNRKQSFDLTHIAFLGMDHLVLSMKLIRNVMRMKKRKIVFAKKWWRTSRIKILVTHWFLKCKHTESKYLELYTQTLLYLFASVIMISQRHYFSFSCVDSRYKIWQNRKIV